MTLRSPGALTVDKRVFCDDYDGADEVYISRLCLPAAHDLTVADQDHCDAWRWLIWLPLEGQFVRRQLKFALALTVGSLSEALLRFDEHVSVDDRHDQGRNIE